MYKVFIDGKEGTTGLRIYERIGQRADIELITLSEELRKDRDARAAALNSCDIAFLCLPDAAAIEAVSLIENPDVMVIDTSTAHRTSPDWAYGFPELSEAHRKAVVNAKRVSVPGCHASGFISLVAPLVAAGVIDTDALLHCHSLTGYSGGGKKMIAAYGDENRPADYDAPRQYGLGQTHKHLPEMAVRTGLDTAPVFCPIVSDFYSGMLVTVGLFAGQVNGASVEKIAEVYRKVYNSGVVKYVESSQFAPDGFISAASMTGLDTMEVTVTGTADRILLMSRFDNLGKGASGAAVQCMNLMLGLDETAGLAVN